MRITAKITLYRRNTYNFTIFPQVAVLGFGIDRILRYEAGLSFPLHYGRRLFSLFLIQPDKGRQIIGPIMITILILIPDYAYTTTILNIMEDLKF